MFNFIGIDPGARGALSIIHDGGVDTAVYDIPSYIHFLSCCDPANSFAVVEQVHAMPKNGAVSMFNFGCNFGIIQGLLMMHGIPYQLVPPQKWKKAYSLTFPKGTDKAKIKAASCEKAMQLFPCVSLLETPRCKRPHDGIAESLLIALYAKRLYTGSMTG